MQADAALLPTFADVVAAAERIGSRAARTPVMSSAALDERAGRRVVFKCENLQHGGAFKYRGALNAVLPLAVAGGITAVATHSSGNHGTALALAARVCGLQAHVVVPRDSARPKIAAIERAGGHVIFCEPGLAAREAALAELLRRIDAHVVHPFDDARVIAGQGTAALELFSDEPDLDVICTPIGGGGLIGGTALAAKAIAPRCDVVGAEPLEADDAYRSFHSGTRQAAVAPATIADGLRGSIGVLNFELLRRYVQDVVTVTEREIMDAMRVVLQDLKLLIEPSSAVAVAALLAGKLGRSGQRVGIILSGGNVDLEQCPYLRGERLT
ncbi:MAG: pyridoxal-phosphate dependent enzyme [Steroidobacteraceae bacterium]